MTTTIFDNSFAREMTGFFVPWKGAETPSPSILTFNMRLATELGFDAAMWSSDDGASFLSGASVPEGASPLAMAYAGHQFGHFVPQLGDGRALLIGEIVDRHGDRYDLHLKGSGRTPFSRGGDGKAVLGPVLREYLISEAMHALGIPTTRSLAVVTTGEEIERDGYQPGAVLARIAASHLRIGTFQYFAARGDWDRVRQLADYAIRRHFPELADAPYRYLRFLEIVRDRQAALIAKWMLVGFVHGVMNTDNMTISGETIDYGPCAFMDYHDPRTVFSSIDRAGRYAYGNQPVIAQWNLARFAECLLPLIAADDSDKAVRQATEAIEAFPGIYRQEWLAGMRRKLGLALPDDGDSSLVDELHTLLEAYHPDHTLFFRRLPSAIPGDQKEIPGMFGDDASANDWLSRWRARLSREAVPADECIALMNRNNPLYIPRNHKVEDALAAAIRGDLGLFDRLLAALANPFVERSGLDDLTQPAHRNASPYRTYCGT